VSHARRLDTGEVAGTLAYMAPNTEGKIRTAHDIWSLGWCYELAAHLPFHGGTSLSKHCHICGSHRRVAIHVTPGLRAVIMRCLAKEPEKRYQRASEVRAAMEACSRYGITSRVPQSLRRILEFVCVVMRVF